ncbi:MAG: DnaJ domain-containing protein [Candidatus Shikimatogenerans sp. JK-2022]|nr:DnaJ domain-containing protein [Candidatus Shikimatogenerans bostrichidophilus]
MKDYYKILGIPKDSNLEDIKKSYRKLAIKYHPDKNPKNKKEAEEKFKEAAEAYSVLSDNKKRQQYDKFGTIGEGEQINVNMDMEDIFTNFGDIFNDDLGSFTEFSFSTIKNKKRRRRKNKKKGENLRIKLKITLEEIYKGISKNIKIKRMKLAPGIKFKYCDNCNGTGVITNIKNTFLGSMQTTIQCNFCQGLGQIMTNIPFNANYQGLIPEEKIIKINIPAGIKDGYKYKVYGKGNDSPTGGLPGDLIIILQEKPHKKFKRQGYNLYYKKYISIPEAILGTEKTIKFLNKKKIKIKIPKGIQEGEKLQLKGKGLYNHNINSYGNLIIEVHIWIPKKINTEQKIFFKKNIKNKNFIPKI